MRPSTHTRSFGIRPSGGGRDAGTDISHRQIPLLKVTCWHIVSFRCCERKRLIPAQIAHRSGIYSPTIPGDFAQRSGMKSPEANKRLFWPF
jgi:hypothetical protein